VNRELAEAEARLKELQKQWNAPVPGGPRVTVRTVLEAESHIKRLREERDALLQQREELQRLQAEQKEWIDTLTSSLGVAEETESEVYRDGVRILKILIESLDVTLERIIAYRQNVDRRHRPGFTDPLGRMGTGDDARRTAEDAGGDHRSYVACAGG